MPSDNSEQPIKTFEFPSLGDGRADHRLGVAGFVDTSDPKPSNDAEISQKSIPMPLGKEALMHLLKLPDKE